MNMVPKGFRIAGGPVHMLPVWLTLIHKHRRAVPLMWATVDNLPGVNSITWS